MTVRLVSWGIVGLLLGLCVGCGPENPLNRQGISGTVTFNGEPANGTIQFVPAAGATSTIAGGNIEKGKYVVAAEGGVAPGEYSVAISIGDPNWDPKKSPKPKEMAPPEYTQGKHKVTVKEGANVFDFDVKTK